MGWLEDRIDELNAASSSFYEAATSGNPMLTVDMTQIDGVQAIMDVVQPVALGVGLALLILLGMLELYNLSQQHQLYSGGSSLEMMFVAMLKFFVGIIVVSYAPALANAVFSVGQAVVQMLADALAALLGAGMGDLLSGEEGEQPGFFMSLVVWAVMFVQLLVVAGVSLGRLVKGILFVMFAPIPVAMLFGSETKSIGIGYARNMIALCIQGAILVAVMAFFPMLADFVQEVCKEAWGGVLGIATAIVVKIVIAVQVIAITLKSSAISKELVGA